MTDEARKVIMVRLAPDMHRWLRQHALDTDTPMQVIVETLISRYRSVAGRKA